MIRVFVFYFLSGSKFHRTYIVALINKYIQAPGQFNDKTIQLTCDRITIEEQ